jgi:hypothetical protein
MHLRVRPLQVLIELFPLVVAQDLADLFIGLIALGPHLARPFSGTVYLFTVGSVHLLQ